MKPVSLPRLIINLCTLMLLSLFASGCAVVNVDLGERLAPYQEVTIEGKGKAKILLLDVSGVITYQSRKQALGPEEPSLPDRLAEQLALAIADQEIKGVIVRINSPGGTVAASDALYHELRRFQSRRDIPVYAYIMGLGASGGYYTAAAAQRIYAQPTSVTASIGVIAVQMNIEGLMQKIGVEDKTYTAGLSKDMYSPFRKDTPQEQQMIQGMLDEFHERFKGIVRESRGKRLPVEQEARVLDGRIMTAQDALDSGLIDAILYLDEVIDEMRKTRGLDEARVVTYVRPGGYRGSLYAGTMAKEPSLLGVDFSSVLKPGETGFFYLFEQ